MPTSDEILDAVAQSAEDGIARTKVGSSETELMSVDDRIKAANFVAGDTAGGLTLFGMRRVQQVPPGAG